MQEERCERGWEEEDDDMEEKKRVNAVSFFSFNNKS